MNKKRLLELAGITEATYMGQQQEYIVVPHPEAPNPGNLVYYGPFSEKDAKLFKRFLKQEQEYPKNWKIEIYPLTHEPVEWHSNVG
jgi:hypothetical protein